MSNQQDGNNTGGAAPNPVTVQWGDVDACGPQTVKAGEVRATFSPNGHALSLLFDTLQVDAQGSDKALNIVCVATVSIPVTVPDDQILVGYLSSLEGSVSKSGGSRVVLLADIAGTSKTIEFPYDTEMDTGDINAQMFSIESRQPVNTNIPRASLPPFIANIMLSIARRSPEESAFISIGAIDVVVIFDRFSS